MALASVIGVRYLAIGTGDTDLYVFAGILAVAVISIRVFLFRGVNCVTDIPPRRNGFSGCTLVLCKGQRKLIREAVQVPFVNM